MIPKAEAFKKERIHEHKKEYLQNELELPPIESRRPNELINRPELEALAENIEQVYYQDIKLLMKRRAAVRDREQLLPFGIPKATSSTTLMETRAI